jgi:hypothetical protein
MDTEDTFDDNARSHIAAATAYAATTPESRATISTNPAPCKCTV